MNDDWLARWRDGRTGFHEGRPNDLLVRHASWLAGARRVLVPLCGKAEDLAFLAARGHDVVGIELAEPAVRAFFAEHGIAPEIEPRGPMTEYRSGASAGASGAVASAGAAGATDAAGGAAGSVGGSITLLAGDFFAVTAELLGPIDAVYDRAALVALPLELRSPYVARLRTWLPAGARSLVITLEYDQRAVAGPPFAVLEAELRALYAGESLALLEERPGEVTKCAQTGAPVTERCFAIGPGTAQTWCRTGVLEAPAGIP
jgi:thiopurine S-methyltransferase